MLAFDETQKNTYISMNYEVHMKYEQIAFQ